MSIRQNVRSAKRPSAKCPFGKMSFGKMSFGKVSFGKLSGHLFATMKYFMLKQYFGIIVALLMRGVGASLYF
jgi:hypothetical protein